MIKKINIIIYSLIGELLKLYYCLFRKTISYGVNTTEIRDEKVIVSITSYGRRVSSVLPYTIISLLQQTYKPDVLVLWLDHDNWNIDNLPDKLKQLQKSGLTIKFCQDLKSYKKLIPALELYPNDLIITCDDDLFYKKRMIEKLIKEYKKDTTKIYAHIAHKITFNKTKLNCYNNWDMDIKKTSGYCVFPTSGGGCLYKRCLLYKDILQKELFMSLSPNADDVWFYFMAYLNGTKCTVINNKHKIYIPLDFFYQFFHENSSLSSSNCGHSQNDVQIKNVMDYYEISHEEFCNKLNTK